MDAIQSNDAALQAAVAAIRTATGTYDMCNNFEDAVSYLLPYDPVAKKRNSVDKRGVSEISDTTAHWKLWCIFKTPYS